MTIVTGKHTDILIELLIYYLSKKYIISSQQIEDIAYLWNWDVDQVKQIHEKQKHV